MKKIVEHTRAIGKTKEELWSMVTELVKDGRVALDYPDLVGASKDELRWTQSMVKYEE